MVAERSSRLAVLIDAENASPSVADALFDEVARHGEASVRRAYGDFTGSRLKTWTSILAKHAIQPQQQFSNTAGKNASDIALVIDAMDLLHAGRVDGFCLVSSDSDFTRLASRIREHGLDVIGFGERDKAPESLRQACRLFIYTENLVPINKAADGSGPANRPKPANAAVPLLRKVMEQVAADDGWALLSSVGSTLQKLASDFDSRTYGFQKLGDLVRNAGVFDVDGEGGRVRIRFNPKQKRPPSLPPT